MYLMSGSMKVSKPKSELDRQLPWVEDFSSGTVKLIGTAELAGAVGLVVPALTGTAVTPSESDPTSHTTQPTSHRLNQRRTPCVPSP